MTDQRLAQAYVYLVLQHSRRGETTIKSVHRDAWPAIAAVLEDLGDKIEHQTFAASDHAHGMVFQAHDLRDASTWDVVRRMITGEQ